MWAKWLALQAPLPTHSSLLVCTESARSLRRRAPTRINSAETGAAAQAMGLQPLIIRLLLLCCMGVCVWVCVRVITCQIV